MNIILAATGNQHKLREIRQILEPHGISVLGAEDVGGITDVLEDGHTFEQNAIKKACQVAQATEQCVVADDSGLEVIALNGIPGVRSARYAGDDATDEENVAKLLQHLRDVPERHARFVCVVAVASPKGLIGTACGEVKGTIISTPRGEGGFGYDPVFEPEGFDRTFAELPSDTKNALSHRSEALAAALEKGLFS